MAESNEQVKLRAELEQLRKRRRQYIDDVFDDLEFDVETHGLRRRHRALLDQLRHDLEMLHELREQLMQLRYQGEELVEKLEVTQER